MADDFGLPEIQDLKDQICADWVNRLDLKVISAEPTHAKFLWTATPELLRTVNDGEKIVSGQATMAVADTASFMTICGINGCFRNCVTVDLHTNFMRPLFDGVIELEVTAIASGRKTVTTRSDFRMQGTEKLAATATGVFMYLD